jgi:hypothetical protein
VIQVNLKTKTASREPLPVFLHGLTQESLLDLSWTDSALGVQDLAWFPESNVNPPLNETQYFGAESFKIDFENKIVEVSNEILNYTKQEIENQQIAIRKEKAKRDIFALESSITPRRTREAILGTDNGWLADVESQIETLRTQL